MRIKAVTSVGVYTQQRVLANKIIKISKKIA